MSANVLDARQIFLEAVEKYAPEAWNGYLEEACQNDAALRARVEALLAAHGQYNKLLDASNLAGTIDSPPRERVGMQIGPYKLLEQIGEGGFGIVYMAEQAAPVRRRVALKLIKPGMDTNQVIARFEAERQALAVMDHPNIAKVLDAGATESGRPYFVMELVCGVPITQYCDEHSLAVRERLGLFVAICQAIQHAHTKGIIHRDIKPTNVLVSAQDGQPVVKVIDFGIAKAMAQRLTDRTLFTAFAQLIGTPLYMSPEQAAPGSNDIDTRSDVYSLGVLLYELLTGSTPVSKEQLKQAAFDEIRRIIREEEPQKPSTRISTAEAAPSIAAQRHTEPGKLARLVRGELDWIVMKALEKDRNRRYETASGIARDVERFLNDEPVQACPPSAAYRFKKFARRNKAAFTTGALVAVLLIIAVVVLAVSNVRVTAERNAKDKALEEKVRALSEKQTALVEKQAALTEAQTNFAEAKHQEVLAKEQQQIATAQTTLAKRRLHASQMNLAMQAWRAGEVPRVLELLEGQRPGPDDEDLRGFEWYYLWRLCNAGHRLYPRGHTGAVLSVAFSPDGATLASASWDGTVRLWDTTTGQERKVLRGHVRGPWNVAFSPDGKTLASSGQETESLILWDVTTGKPLHTIAGPVVGPVFSRDGSVIAGGLITESGTDIKLWDVATGEVRLTLRNAGSAIAFLPHERTLVTMSSQFAAGSEVQFWDLEMQTQRRKIPVPGILNAVLCADGTRLATSSWSAVALWDTATGQQQASFSQQSAMRALAFSPDGKKLAAGNELRTVVIWDVDSGRTLGEDVHLDPVWCVAFSPDGKTLASSTAGGAIKLWDMTPAEESTTIRDTGGVKSLGFDSSGRTLLVGNPGPTRVIDVAAGKEVAVLPASDVMAISADAGVLAAPGGSEEGVLWNVRARNTVAAFPLQRTGVNPGVTLSPDGKFVATYYRYQGDNTVKLWDDSQREPRTLKIAPPYGNRLAVECAEFSPDGKLLAAGFQFQWVTVWDLTTDKVILQFSQPPAMMWVRSVAFSPDSKALAVGTDVGVVTLWDVKSGKCLASFRGHTSNVHALTFAPDGKTLASAGADKTVRLWDVITGQEQGTLTGHGCPVFGVRFSPDGNTLATSGADGTVKLWRAAIDPEALARRISVAADDPHYVIATDYHRSAWYLATSDKVEERDPARAVQLAQKALELFPMSARYWVTLGVGHYRAGHWQAAVAALDKSNELAPRRNVFAEFFRAMALWELGDREHALNGYKRASEWVAGNAPHDPWCARFQREAAELMGQPVPPTLNLPLPTGSITVVEKLSELQRRRAAIDERWAAAPKERWDRWQLASEYHQLAATLIDLVQFSEAEAVCRQALSAFRALADEDPREIQFDYDIGWASYLLSDVLMRCRRVEEAEPLARESLARFRDLAEIRPDVPEYRDAIATANGLLSHVLIKKPEEAAQAQRDALASRQAADELRRTLPSAKDLLDSARAFAEKRDWKQAAMELNKGFERHPRSDMFLCFSAALARLLAGDVEGYVRLSAPAASKWSRWYRLDVLRTCTLHPRGIADPGALVPLAQSAYDEQANNWSAQNLGMAHYRAGEFEEALRRMEESQKFAEWYLFFPALAMTHHQLGHPDEARQWLDKANEFFRDFTPTGGERLKVLQDDPYWQDWAYFEVMLQEANALIRAEK